MEIVSLLGLIFSGNAVGTDPESWTKAMREHWAWKPVENRPLPEVRHPNGGSHGIDRWILAELQKAGLDPAPAAAPLPLLRRVSFDLTGLPPTTEEIDAFLLAQSAEGFARAWEKTIDRLLASPQYGVRWARHWLDLARYAESNGFEFDEIRPDAWRYRDYVVDAFNRDKPYDQFLREQLAGDEIEPVQPEALVATGFALLGPDMTDSSDQVRRRQNTLNDMLDTAGFAFLGLSLACARCHDHKFEPLSQKDYYSLQAFFTPVSFHNDLNLLSAPKKKELEIAFRAFEAQSKPLREEFAKLEGPYRARLRQAKLVKQSPEVREAHETPAEKRTPAQRERVEETLRFVGVSQAEILKEMTAEERKRHKDLADRLNKLEAKRPRFPTAMGLGNDLPPDAKAPLTHILERGELSQPAEVVHPGFPEVFRMGPAGATLADGSLALAKGRRTKLAQWMTRPDNPLTARVMVNRIWHHHFGRGIVGTPSDFGVRGDRPSHPQLLDWLASEFVASNWSVKKLHKTILMSATYQQSSLASAKAIEKDPQNRLFGRMNRQRLEAEPIRDAMLAAGGLLDLSLGGPSAPATESALGPKAKAKPAAAGVANSTAAKRRSLYLFARRNARLPFLEVFDLPDSNLSCPSRERSTTAPQALALLNAPEVEVAAQALAGRLRREAPSLDQQIALGYRLTLTRDPRETELVLARRFLSESPLEEFCRALLNLNEFVFVD